MTRSNGPIAAHSTKKRPVATLATALLAATLLLASCGPPDEAPPTPNVVFIMADDMGWGDVASYNPESLTPTPNIDRLAAEGLSFTDAHSGAAVCTPTRYEIMTGRFFWRTYKGHSLVMPYDPPVIPPERLTWGRMMRERGYTTAYVGKWHLGLWYPARPQTGWQRQYTMTEDEVDFSRPVKGGPTDLGFDHFFGNAGGPSNDSPYTFIRNDRWVEIPTARTPPEMFAQPGVIEGLMAPEWDQVDVDTRLTREAVAYIAELASRPEGEPFFLYYSLSTPHIPWLPPDFIQGASGEGPRGDMNALADWVVGQVVGELESQGVLDETLVIFTSDNGPRRGANGQQSAGPFRGFKNTPYEGGHRVPFIARWPGQIAAGGRSDVPLSLTDLFATFAELVGYDLPDDAAEDSYGRLSALLGQDSALGGRPALLAHTSRGDFSVRSGTWKLISLNPLPGADAQRVVYELYDLAKDPYETTDLASAHPEIVERLTRLLEKTRGTGLRFMDASQSK